MNLVLLVCLASNPAACRDEQLGAAAQPMGCMLAAPAAIVEWSEAHPEWTVARWRCEPLEQSARR